MKKIINKIMFWLIDYFYAFGKEIKPMIIMTFFLLLLPTVVRGFGEITNIAIGLINHTPGYISSGYIMLEILWFVFSISAMFGAIYFIIWISDYYNSLIDWGEEK